MVRFGTKTAGAFLPFSIGKNPQLKKGRQRRPFPIMLQPSYFTNTENASEETPLLLAIWISSTRFPCKSNIHNIGV